MRGYDIMRPKSDNNALNKRFWASFGLLATLCLAISGCLRTQPIILTEEDRIFTLREGTPITLYLDKVKKDMVFPYDMKIVSPKILVKQEQLLNSETLKKIKAEKSKGDIMKIAGSIFAVLGGLIGMLAKRKKK